MLNIRNTKPMTTLLIIIALLTAVIGCSSASSSTGSSGASNVSAASNNPIKLTLGTISHSDSVDGLTAVKFKELVEKNSNGRLKIDIFHSSQLGPTNAQVEGTMAGTQDLLMLGVDFYEKWVPDMRILSTFYVFDSDDHYDKYIKSDLFKETIKQLDQKNLTFINRKMNWITGPYRVLVTTKPVNTPDDLKGMKLRTPEVETNQRSWRELGATPVTITFSETYLSLKQGIVSGLENPISLIRPNKFTEVTKYLTEVRTFPQRMGLAMNLNKLQSLPGDLQQVLYTASDEAGDYYTQVVIDSAKKDLEAMQKEDGVTILKPDLKPWKNKMVPFIRQLENEGYLRKGLYDQIQALK